MSATYNLFKSPPPQQKEGVKARLHARLVNQHTVRIDRLCEEISEISSFSSSDVKGMLDALQSRIAFHLAYGDIVERWAGHIHRLAEMPVSHLRERDQASPGTFQQGDLPVLERAKE